VIPTPTTAPRLAVDLQTLGQIRPLWSIDAPGAGSLITALQCQTASCDMLTRIGAYRFSPDSSTLAVGVCKGNPTENKSGNKQPRYACPDGGEVQLYPALTGSTHDSLDSAGFPTALAFDPSGKTLAVGTADGSVELWDLASRQQLGVLQHPSKHDGVTSLVFSPDGTLLFSQGEGKVVAWDWAQGTDVKTLDGWGAMSLDAAGQHLVTGWFDPNAASVIVRIFDLANLGALQDIRPKFVQANMLDQEIRAAFSPDGQKVVILGSNGAEWWDAQGKQAQGHTDVQKLIADPNAAFAPIGSFLPSGLVLTEQGVPLPIPGLPLSPVGPGGTFGCGFALWDPTMAGAYAITAPASGCQAGTTVGDGRRAVISSDGTLVAADSGAGNLRVWDVDPTAAPVQQTCLGTCTQ
jgi:WD40 repeat protein